MSDAAIAAVCGLLVLALFALVDLLLAIRFDEQMRRKSPRPHPPEVAGEPRGRACATRPAFPRSIDRRPRERRRGR